MEHPSIWRGVVAALLAAAMIVGTAILATAG
jgi:hypothetical protein